MSAPFAVDPTTGHIRFPELNLELSPQMAETEFIATTARLNRDNLGANDSWQRYSLRSLISDDRKLGLFVIFLNGQLNKVSFAYGHKDETWDNWTAERDAAEQREYQGQLDAQLGGKSTFPWGRISVLVDSKSGGIEIWVDYGEQRTYSMPT